MLDRTTLRIGWALVVLASLGLAAALAELPFALVRVPLGLVLAWVAPGYALLMLLYPRRLGGAARLALSMPLSFALTVLLGIILDRIPGGLAGPTVLIAQWGLAAALALLASLLDRTRSSADEVSAPPQRTRVRSAGPAHLALAGLLALGCLWALTGLGAAAQVTPTPYAALAVEGSGATTRVVIANEQGRPERYRLELVAGGATLQRWDDIRLESGGRHVLTLQASAPGAEVRLYRDGEAAALRHVQLP